VLTLRIDPWAASYESALQIGEDEAPTQVSVQTDVEPGDWLPRRPAPLPAPESIAFIDGVQRVEMRVIGDEDGRLVYGAFTSIGVGAAVTSPGRHSRIESGLPHRIIALGGGSACPPWEVPCGAACLTFRAESSPDSGADGWRNAVRRVRHDAERALGQRMVEAGHPLVIIDGRLTFQPSQRSHAVGVAKTIRTVYLQPPYSDILRELRPGMRTPMFMIDYKDPVYSWYIRLAQPRPFEHEWAGLVQVETMAGIGRDQAVRLADITALHLPAFASHAAWDARAPQNMFPIAGLEQRLRHELGDHDWVRRNLEAHFHRSGGLG
jgi:hypothetical protein